MEFGARRLMRPGVDVGVERHRRRGVDRADVVVNDIHVGRKLVGRDFYDWSEPSHFMCNPIKPRSWKENPQWWLGRAIIGVAVVEVSWEMKDESLLYEVI